MENMVWIIYLIDVVCDGFTGVAIILGTVWVLSLMLVVMDKINPDHVTEAARSFPLKTIIVFCTVVLFLVNFIPSKDTAYKMLAAYGVNEVYQSEDVQNLLGDGMDILKMTLADYKEELGKEK